MRILIVDDEHLARQRLRDLLGGIPGCEIAGEIDNGAAALEMAAQNDLDLVLLDIRMPGMDGLEVAQHLHTLPEPPAVVFCTAYSDHALEAFEANAIDYLVKPIRRVRLAQAVAKAARLNEQALSDALATERRARTHLCARVRNNLKLVPIETVIFLLADQKYVTVRHTGGEILVDESLTALEAEFGERFVRIHRNALVARAYLAGLESRGEQHVVLMKQADEQLEVSRRNLASLRQVMKTI